MRYEDFAVDSIQVEASKGADRWEGYANLLKGEGRGDLSDLCLRVMDAMCDVMDEVARVTADWDKK